MTTLSRQRLKDIAAIRAALIEGEQSGEPQPFDGDLLKKEMAAAAGMSDPTH